MFFTLFVVIFFSEIALILFIFGVETPKHLINKKCNTMIQRIQPDNPSPELTTMINYHRDNAQNAVKYEL